jgi:tripartite-type tricarboxylate transporter receptor subunit TctC
MGHAVCIDDTIKFLKLGGTNMSSITKTTMVAAALAISSGAALPASAADFAGKQVTVQVPSGSGGTYHVYCQIVTRHIGKHIPGQPTVVIQNMPGAGGAKSASYMYNAAPKDGTILAMMAPGNASGALVRKLKYDARKFNWLGSVAARGNGIAVWHDVPVSNWQDLKTTEVTIGSTGISSAGSIFPMLANALLGTKMKLVQGYKGGGAVNLAIERKEVNGRWNFYSGFTGVRPQWISGNKLKFLLQFGPPNPGMKGVPHMRDLLKEGTKERRMFDVMAMDLEVGQAFYLPPGVPKKTVAMMEKAFSDMIADPATKKEVLDRRIEWSPLTKAQILSLHKRGYSAATPEVLASLRGMLVKKKKK